MKSDLLLAVTQLAAERNLPNDVVISAVQAALASAYKRDPAAAGQDVTVDLDSETGEVTVRTGYVVVEEVEEPGLQLTLEEAQKNKADAQLGEFIITGSIEHNPGRIAAQTAKQVVMQRLREAERELVFDEYVDKAGEVFTGTIQRIEPRFITVDLGRAEAVFPPQEQVPYERYRPGQQLKFYVVDVARTVRGPEIIISRTHTELLRRLFEMEVPEIFNGVIEIKSMAREPGSRSKVAVQSHQDGVDAVGACVGLRGLRIQNIVNELLGEKIDVIEWSDDPARFIANSLSPAIVDEVRLDEATRSASVVVPDRVLSLAIGRDGQNARLAAKLSNWSVDIQPSSAMAAPQAPETPPSELLPEEATPQVAAIAQPAEEVAAPGVVVAAAQAEPAIAAEVAAEVVPAAVGQPADEIRDAEAEATAARVTEELALRALEEELAILEREEAERRKAEEEASTTVEISSGDIWQVASRETVEEAGTLRFAEDIVGFRDFAEGRRGRGGRGGGNKGSAKARKAAARKARP